MGQLPAFQERHRVTGLRAVQQGLVVEADHLSEQLRIVGVQACQRLQLRRYEAGNSKPTLDVLRNLALTLSVSSDALVFDADERGPSDDLRLQFEATNQLDDEGKALVKALIEGVLLRHEAHRWTTHAS